MLGLLGNQQTAHGRYSYNRSLWPHGDGRRDDRPVASGSAEVPRIWTASWPLPVPSLSPERGP
eukprot:14315716-Alexandrium_andersonii.AAC.1